MSEFFTVPDSEAGGRLDKFLVSRVPDLSRERIKEHIEQGQILHNGSNAKASAKLKAGDSISFTLLPVKTLSIAPENIPLEILFEDEDILVLNKPAGLVVHPGDGHLSGTLVNALMHHTGGKLSDVTLEGNRPGIVHRLDKDTSGVMVVCKTNRSYHGLQPQFADHSIDREYKAVVWGIPQPIQGTIEAPIGRDPRNRQKMAVLNRGGKPAVTHYKVDKTFGIRAALVSVTLETGRTHQIRVHMTHLGTPVIGDQVYGPRRKRPVDFPRQALHAAVLGFDHPLTKQRLRFSTPVPQDISDLLNLLA